jgi:hypothetical protein
MLEYQVKEGVGVMQGEPVLRPVGFGERGLPSNPRAAHNRYWPKLVFSEDDLA